MVFYLLYDLSNYSDDDIKGHVINQSIMLLLIDIQKKNLNDLTDTFIRVALFLKDLENKQKGIEYFEIFLRYTSADFSPFVVTTDFLLCFHPPVRPPRVRTQSFTPYIRHIYPKQFRVAIGL
jgi:hypothetical protein